MEGKKYFATGKRKTAIARVWMEPGNGKISINKRTVDDYFGGLSTKKAAVRLPLQLTDVEGRYDTYINVQGGGLTGQAEAIRHGISKTLLMIDPEFRAILKKASLITRDSRIKERQKYGLAGARKRFQYSKR